MSSDIAGIVASALEEAVNAACSAIYATVRANPQLRPQAGSAARWEDLTPNEQAIHRANARRIIEPAAAVFVARLQLELRR